MKKKLLSLGAMALCAATVLGACSGGSKNLKLATGGTSGTYYPYGGALAQVISAKVPDMQFDVQSTGASAANIRLVAGGEADLAIVQNDVMSYAYTGTETFDGDKVDGFSTVATLYAEVCQIVADPGAGITSVADLKGKRVSVGDAGSGVEANAKQILAAYGLSFEDITVQNLSFGDSASAMKDKKIDAFFVTAGPPTTAVMELSSTNEIALIPIDQDKIDQLIASYPFYTAYTIGKDVYGTAQDVPTLAVKATLIANPKMSEDSVYQLTKALFEGKDQIAAAHAKGAELDVNEAIKGASVPFHPGAEKYFREVGVLK